jgi:hypothetical protein
MAVSTVVTQAELARVMAEAYTGQVVTVALVDAASAPAATASIATWLQYELAPANGYARYQSSTLTDGAYSAGNTRWQHDPIPVEFTASGGSFAYTHLVAIIGGAADGQIGSTITASSGVNASTNRITLTAHGLTTGDPVTLTVDSGGTLPGGLAAGTLYYALVVDANTLSLMTTSTGSTAIDLTSTGSGTLRLRDCSGSIHSIMTETAQVTVASGQTVAYQFTVAVDD